ncbi:hypothetical protein HPB47_009907 [Ixodes persulcatus]|uniref:Uncharacterized protein n=1 Tax=Ixodes persulcatus TaxID=34615 RepID=A0AC60P0U6_IXOPE|nr:hypothetical protein HPB47_009907 [Ixodes persulcatus]
MTPEESLEYEKVKLSLLRRFRYTTDGYREKFPECKSEEAKTRKQSGARLLGYFDRLIETGETPKTFEGLRDLIVCDQFLKRCSTKRAIFLMERNCKCLENLASADHFLEARGQTCLAKIKEEKLGHKGGARNKEGGRPQLQARKRLVAFSATSRVTERPIAGLVPRTSAALCAGDVERLGTSQRRVPGSQNERMTRRPKLFVR